jgi:hypothetical protein
MFFNKFSIQSTPLFAERNIPQFFRLRNEKIPRSRLASGDHCFDYELQESIRAAWLVDVPADIAFAVAAGNHRLTGGIPPTGAVICLA